MRKNVWTRVRMKRITFCILPENMLSLSRVRTRSTARAFTSARSCPPARSRPRVRSRPLASFIFPSPASGNPPRLRLPLPFPSVSWRSGHQPTCFPPPPLASRRLSLPPFIPHSIVTNITDGITFVSNEPYIAYSRVFSVAGSH